MVGKFPLYIRIIYLHRVALHPQSLTLQPSGSCFTNLSEFSFNMHNHSSSTVAVLVLLTLACCLSSTNCIPTSVDSGYRLKPPVLENRRLIDRPRLLQDISVRSRELSVNSSSRIIGGTRSSRLAPYMVGLYYKFAEGKNGAVLFCSGVLISRYWVATAAHCDAGIGYNWAFVGANMAGNGVQIRVQKIFKPKQTGRRHYRYNRDVAFVRLSEPAPKGSKFVRVNVDSSRLDGDATVAGYGASTPGRNGGLPPLDEILRETRVSMVPLKECRKHYAKLRLPMRLSWRMTCAGRVGAGPCNSDSGGPLLKYDNRGRPVLVGLVSAAIKCGGKTPTIFTRTVGYLKFMRRNNIPFEKGPKSMR